MDNCDFTVPLPGYTYFWECNCIAYLYKTFRFIDMLPFYIEPPSYNYFVTANNTHVVSYQKSALDAVCVKCATIVLIGREVNS